MAGMKVNGRSMVRAELCTVLSLITLLALVVLDKGCASLPLFRTSIPSPGVTVSGFVTRSGSQLMLNGRPFRFARANIHWLALDDSTSYPSQFRVNDALDATKAMGATVIRSHSLGISVGCGNCIEPAPGVFNETTLVHDDYVIKAAGEHGIRLIIPLTDNYHYAQGGKHTFTDWRGILDENQFYYNHQVISDFETYIRTLLNRVNTYTGVAYKDDPTIMAWETGNELDPPTSWTQTISTYIKSIDHNHLGLGGRRAIDPHAASLTNVNQLRTHAFKMRGIPLPTFNAPGVHLIDVVIRNAASDVLVWRGTALAASYSIERSTSGASGPWTVICDRCATDNSTPWVDTTAPAGALWYRVIAYNLSGVAGSPSSPYHAGSGVIVIDTFDTGSKPSDQ